MPSRLKSFELHGYKTFASRNEFQFSDGITAIVGPNGSGKSNIADALRWVLGEQSFGLLRAKKTEDMIFSGSDNRPRAGMASATIVFDNSDSWLPIDFGEVGITRRAYRDGENEYLLNGQRVRLRDVSEVLAKSGLAERTYTIIGQGLVDAALALKAEERRRLFEEAAGIGLYRSRKEESEKRLDTTQRNLERIHDILAELQPRLRSLERQAKRAQEYNQLRDELKLVLREWYGYQWYRAQDELTKVQELARLNEEAFIKEQGSQHELDQKLNDYRIKINELRTLLTDQHKQLTVLHQRRELISREQAVNGERLRSLMDQLEQRTHDRAHIEEETGIQKDQLETSKEELAQLEQELLEAQKSLSFSQEKLSVRIGERSILENKINNLNQQIAELTSQTTRQKVLLSEKQNLINRIKDSIQKIDQEVTSNEIDLAEAEYQLQTLSIEKQEKSATTLMVKSELDLIIEKRSAVNQEQLTMEAQISNQKTRITQLEAEKNVLEEADKNLIGYNEGARILLQAVNNKSISGAIGSLGNNLIVPKEYESAVAAILGEYIDSLVIESISQSDSVLDLIDGDAIRGSILPIDAITPNKPVLIDFEKAPVNRENIIGIASQVVEADEILKPIIDLLLDHAIIVKDRKTARAIISSRNIKEISNLCVVTLKGEVYLSNGPIVSGATGKGLLARPRQQREIKSILAQAADNLTGLERQMNKLQEKSNDLLIQENSVAEKYKKAVEFEGLSTGNISRQELQIEKIQHDLQWRRDQKNKFLTDLTENEQLLANINNDLSTLNELFTECKAELDESTIELESMPFEELQAQAAYWTTNVAVIEQALLDSRNRSNEKEVQLKTAESSLADIIIRFSQLEGELKSLHESMSITSNEEVNIAGKIDELVKKVDPFEKQLSDLESEYTWQLSSDVEIRQRLRVAEQKYTQTKIDLARHQESFEGLRRHIEDDFGLVSFEYSESVTGPKPLPLEEMVEELPRVESISFEIEETIRQKKAQIRRMGPISLEAQNEYLEVKERFEFLTNQINDLNTAEKDIREVIVELQLLMEKEFKQTFEAVAQEFKQIFTRLFGGGSARLALTDPENLSETGIDIEARLPGRREQGLALLSGGERSLTAAALIFSLLKIAPTPFCILDEVDAMLDEANVSRFRDLLTELSEKTQFIVITHNRNTVQAANIIYGVTMGRDSASQVISLRMDELGEEFGV